MTARLYMDGYMMELLHASCLIDQFVFGLNHHELNIV